MKLTRTQKVQAEAAAAGFETMNYGYNPQMVWLVRSADRKALGVVHRWSIPAWLRGEKRLTCLHGKVLPSCAEAQAVKPEVAA